MIMNTLRLFLILLAVAIIIFLTPNIVRAQDINSNARSVAMANTGVSTTHGADAIGINPAGIGLLDGKRLSISIFPFAMFAGTDFIDMATYQKYFTGVDNGGKKRTGYYLTDADKKVLLSNFRDDVGHFSTNISFQLFGATLRTPVGDFGVSIGDHIAANLSAPKDYATFLLYGNTPGKTFNFNETQVRSWWVRDFSATYAHQFYLPGVKFLSAGVSAKLIQGFGYFGIEDFNSHFTTDPDSFVITGRASMLAHYTGAEFLAQMEGPASFELFPSPVGHGFGIDIGVMAELDNGLAFGISLVDIGSMTWDRNATEISADEDIYLNDFSNGTQLDELQSKLNGKEKSITSFSTSLPTTLHVGASMKFVRLLGKSDQVIFAASLRQGFNNMPGTSTSPRIGLGTEWDFIGGIPLRTGVAFGGYSPVALALGVGFHIERFSLDLSTDNLGVAFSPTASSSSFAIGMHIEF